MLGHRHISDFPHRLRRQPLISSSSTALNLYTFLLLSLPQSSYNRHTGHSYLCLVVVIHMKTLSVSDSEPKRPKFEPILTTAYSDKATDENLTSENWELILDLCDMVQDEGQGGYVIDLLSALESIPTRCQSSRRRGHNYQTACESKS